MRAPAFVSLLLSAGLALAMGGCAAWTDYSRVPETAVAAEQLEASVWRDQLDSSPFLVEVIADRTVLAPGDTITVTVTITNTLDEPVGVSFSSGCTSGWSLWWGMARVDGSAGGCTMAPVSRVFGPGRLPSRSFTWTWDPTRIEPGSYTLIAGLGADGRLEGGEVVLHLRGGR